MNNRIDGERCMSTASTVSGIYSNLLPVSIGLLSIEMKNSNWNDIIDSFRLEPSSGMHVLLCTSIWWNCDTLINVILD